MRSLAQLLFVMWVCSGCAPDLPGRTCQSDSDCGSPLVCGPSGFCVADPTQPDQDMDSAIDVSFDLPIDGDSEPDTVDATDLSCEPNLQYCEGRQIMICNSDGTGSELGAWCDDMVDQAWRCRDGACVSCEGYESPCENEGDCQGEVTCDVDLQCHDDGYCVTTTDGELGDPCWGDSECGGDAPFCYELGDACQSGLPGDPCETEDDCYQGSSCSDDDEEPAVCTAGVVGYPCDSDIQCQSPLVCGPSDMCQEGVVGAACDNENHCLAELFCGPFGSCQLGEEGDYCDPDDTCLTADSCQTDEDCDGLRCNSLERCYDGSLGDPCGHVHDCLNPMVCGPIGCHPGDEGDPCSTDTHCESVLRCALGQCHQPDNAPCNDDTDCGGDYNFCGPIRCQAGEEGDPCEDNADCDDGAGMLCSTLGVCHDGHAGDECLIDDDCTLCTCVDYQCGGGALARSRSVRAL